MTQCTVQAAKDGRIAEIGRWVSYLKEHPSKAHINERDEEGYTALHYATKYNHLQIMKTLVDNKAGWSSLDLGPVVYI